MLLPRWLKAQDATASVLPCTAESTTTGRGAGCSAPSQFISLEKFS